MEDFGPDPSTQPRYPGLGELSPIHRGGGRIQPGGPRVMAKSLALGQTPTSSQVKPMGDAQILAPHRTTQVDVCGGLATEPHFSQYALASSAIFQVGRAYCAPLPENVPFDAPLPHLAAAREGAVALASITSDSE